MTKDEATQERFTPGPWHTCGNGECSCATVMADDYPIAKVTAGEWGDEYPTLEPEGGSIEGRFRAVNRMITYGSVSGDVATANVRLIAKAPEMYALLKRALSEPRRAWFAEAQRVLIEAQTGDPNYQRPTLPEVLARHAAPQPNPTPTPSSEPV